MLMKLPLKYSAGVKVRPTSPLDLFNWLVVMIAFIHSLHLARESKNRPFGLQTNQRICTPLIVQTASGHHLRA